VWFCSDVVFCGVGVGAGVCYGCLGLSWGCLAQFLLCVVCRCCISYTLVWLHGCVLLIVLNFVVGYFVVGYFVVYLLGDSHVALVWVLIWVVGSFVLVFICGVVGYLWVGT